MVGTRTLPVCRQITSTRSPICSALQHYSVDVVVAFYTVPLVFYTMHRRWTTKRPVQDYWCAGGSLPASLLRRCLRASSGAPCRLPA